jgi:hypothetical protein
MINCNNRDWRNYVNRQNSCDDVIHVIIAERQKLSDGAGTARRLRKQPT